MQGLELSLLLFMKINFIFVEGKVNGVILNKKRGINGFGYDPVFFALQDLIKVSERFQQFTKI